MVQPVDYGTVVKAAENASDEEYASPKTAERAVPRWLRYAAWLALCAGIASATGAHIAQLSFLVSNHTMPADAQAVLEWKEETFQQWRVMVIAHTSYEAVQLAVELILMAVCLATRWPGRAWRRYEAGQSACAGRKRRVYFAAAAMATAVSCALSVTELLRMPFTAWIVTNGLPSVFIVSTRLCFGRGWRAALTATAVFGCTTYIATTILAYVSTLHMQERIVGSESIPPLVQLAVTKLAKRVGFPPENFYAWVAADGAYVKTFFGEKIMIHIDWLSEDRIEAMLGIAAHELGHWKDRTAISIPATIAMHTSMCGLMPFLLATKPAAGVLQIFGAANVAYPFGLGLVLAPIVTKAIFALGKPVVMKIRRLGETYADNYAMELGHASGLATGLLKMAKYSPQAMAHPALEALCFSHPQILGRIKAARIYAASHGNSFSIDDLKAELRAMPPGKSETAMPVAKPHIKAKKGRSRRHRRRH